MDTAASETTRSLIFEALRDIYDPELGVIFVDLGLIYDVDMNEKSHLTTTMTLTTPGCPMHESIGDGSEEKHFRTYRGSPAARFGSCGTLHRNLHV